MEIMAEELTEKDSKTVQQCKDHLGYFIAYKDLFSTWKDHTRTRLLHETGAQSRSSKAFQ